MTRTIKYAPFAIADQVGVATPDKTTSPGGLFLRDVAELSVEKADLPSYVESLSTHRQWLIFTDLCLWDELDWLELGSLRGDMVAAEVLLAVAGRVDDRVGAGDII
jgi:hypothetical protein